MAKQMMMVRPAKKGKPMNVHLVLSSISALQQFRVFVDRADDTGSLELHVAEADIELLTVLLDGSVSSSEVVPLDHGSSPQVVREDVPLIDVLPLPILQTRVLFPRLQVGPGVDR